MLLRRRNKKEKNPSRRSKYEKVRIIEQGFRGEVGENEH